MKIILTNQSIITARLIRDKLTDLTGEKLPVIRNIHRDNKDILFRYGNNTPTNGDQGIFNSKEFINFCANKLTFSNWCKENGYSAPIYHRDNNPDSFPILIRTTLTSFGGRGIILCRDEEEFYGNWRGDYYWTKYIPTRKEYRIHVFNKEIWKVFQKDFQGQEEEYPIRNASRGYHFSIKNKDKFTRSQEFISNLVDKLPFKEILFFGLDIGITQQGELFLFELNSACGLNNPSAEEFAKRILECQSHGTIS